MRERRGGGRSETTRVREYKTRPRGVQSNERGMTAGRAARGGLLAKERASRGRHLAGDAHEPRARGGLRAGDRDDNRDDISKSSLA